MLKRLCLLIALLFVCQEAFAQYTKISGFCEDGNYQVQTQGMNSTTRVQRSFPQCTVTVFDNATVNVSTIYSNATGSALSNPFTASADGQWFFYGVPGNRYDVQFSGGTTPNAIPTPFTRADFVAPLAQNVQPINAQTFPGSDTFAKINAAIASAACTTSCIITDGKGLGVAETITSGGITISKQITLLFHGIYTWAGAGIANGFIRLNGGPTQGGANGIILQCDYAYPRSIGYAIVGDATPCGLIYTPSTGSTSAIVGSENGLALVGVRIANMAIVVNGNVNNPISFLATGGGIAPVVIEHTLIINSATNQGFTGAGIALTCSNSGIAQNAQYVFNLSEVGVYSNGSAINSGTGAGGPSNGISLDPTGGTGCGTTGPMAADRIYIQGLTGSHGYIAKAAQNVEISNCFIHSNNLAASGDAIHLENGGSVPVGVVRDCAVDDNDWSANGNVIDVNIPSGVGPRILNMSATGGNAGSGHAEHHFLDLGSGVVGAEIRGNRIVNYSNFGTNINTGTTGIQYVGNSFAAGNGMNVEFGNAFPALPSNGNEIFTNGSNNVFCLYNLASQQWCMNSDSSGNLAVQRNGTTEWRFTGTGYFPQVDNTSNIGDATHRVATAFTEGISSGAADLTLTPNAAVLPSADNTKNLGATATRWATVYTEAVNSGATNLTLNATSSVIPSSDNALTLGLSSARWSAAAISQSVNMGGANQSLSGFIRAPNNSTSFMTARNATNMQDVVLVGVVDGSNNMLYGDGVNGAIYTMRSSTNQFKMSGALMLAGTPTIGTCGTGNITAGSTDLAGNATSTGATSCTIVFSSSSGFSAFPFCVAIDTTRAAALQLTATMATSITVSGLTSNDNFNWICIGR
jgi:hypothetical protein